MSSVYQNHFVIKQKINGSIVSARDSTMQIFEQDDLPQQTSDKAGVLAGPEVPELDWKRDKFHIGEFSAYEGRDFVEAVYRAILKRPPDPVGLSHHLALLEDGESKNVIISSLRHSSEGEKLAVSVEGIRSPSRLKKILAPVHRIKALISKGKL